MYTCLAKGHRLFGIRGPAAVGLLAGLLVLAGCQFGQDGDRDGPQPNIVLIYADDMGYGDVQSFNPDAKIPTPHVDRLAEEGMRFTDAHAPGALCVPSRYGLLTGRHPHRENMVDWTDRALIDPDQTTLASLLDDRGYATYMVGKWHLGFDGGMDYDCSEPLRGGPVDRGFDRYFGLPSSLDIPPYFYIRDDRCVMAPTDSIGDNQSEDEIWTDIQGAFWRGGAIAPNFEHDEVLPRLEEETIAYVNRHEEQEGEPPLFLYLALTAPHTPWLPPDSLEGTSDAGLYGDFVAQVDGVVGRVMNALQHQGMSENTLVLFASDNGPVWYEEDEQHFDHRSTHIYRGMKGDAWEGGHRMPFVARWPDHVPAGTTSDQLVTFTDLVATVADLTGPVLPGDSTDGFSVAPVLTAERDTIPRDGAVIKARNYLTVRDGPWKLIPGLGSGGFTDPRTRKPAAGEPAGQLYHLGNDPREENNLYDERPEVVERLTEQMERYRRQQTSE